MVELVYNVMHNSSFLTQMYPLSCTEKGEGNRNGASIVYQSISPMRLRYASSIQMPMAIKYSASLSPR